MRVESTTLKDAATALLLGLNDKERVELATLVLNSRIEPARRWMRVVIEMFGLSDSAEALIADIDRRFPDESVLKEIESDGGEPIFEAKMILREAQRMGREQAA